MLVMDKGVRFNNRTVHVSYTKYEHSESDSECRFSCNTTSTDSTTLRRRNRNLKLAIQSLKSTINLLTSGAVKYMDSYVETLEKKINLKKLKSKGQMRNSEKLLKDTTIFLTDRVKAMRKTMIEHRVKTEQVLDEVEHLLNGVEEQNEPQHSDFQTFLSPMKGNFLYALFKGRNILFHDKVGLISNIFLNRFMFFNYLFKQLRS